MFFLEKRTTKRLAKSLAKFSLKRTYFEEVDSKVGI